MGSKAKARRQRQYWGLLSCMVGCSVVTGIWIGQAAAGQFLWAAIPGVVTFNGIVLYMGGRKLRTLSG